MRKKRVAYKIITPIVIAIIALTGCARENSAQKTVDNMLGCFERGNIQEAMQYCEEDGGAYERLKQLCGENVSSTIVSTDALMNSDKEKWLQMFSQNRDFQNYIKYFDELILKRYRIGETRQITDGLWEIEVELEMADFSEYEGDIDDILEIADTEYREHPEEYEEIYQRDGDVAAIIAVLDSVSQPICQIMKDQLKSKVTYQIETATFTVKKIGDKFTIQDYIDN